LNIKDFDIDILVSINEENEILLNLIFFIKNFEVAENANLNEAKNLNENAYDEYRLLNINTNNEIYNLLRQQLVVISKVIFKIKLK